jgi:type VI secretion system Hcp family effector
MGIISTPRRVAAIGLIAATVVAAIASAQRTPPSTPSTPSSPSTPNVPDLPVRTPNQDPPLPPTLPSRESSPATPPPPPANAAGPGEALVTIVGARQGRFRGEGVREGSRDRIIALLFDHDLSADKDNAGRPDGRVRTRSLTFTKSIGAASPQIFAAATTGETLETVTFEMYRASGGGGGGGGGGGSEAFYTVTLRDARIVSLKQYTEKGWFYETVGLSYGRIEVEHRASKARAQDAQR